MPTCPVTQMQSDRWDAQSEYSNKRKGRSKRTCCASLDRQITRHFNGSENGRAN